MDALSVLVARLETVAARLEGLHGSATPNSSTNPSTTNSNAAVHAYETLLENEHLKTFFQKSDAVGGLVKDQVSCPECVFNTLRLRFTETLLALKKN